MEEKYNGWANRDTWVVNVWLNNDENNYRRLVNAVKGVSGTKLTLVSDLALLDKLRQYHYGDKVNWENVDLQEIRSMLLDMEEDLLEN